MSADMGTMCAVPCTEPTDFQPRTRGQPDKKEEEEIPLVEDQLKRNNLDKHNMDELIPPANPPSPSASSEEQSIDKQLLQEAIEDIDQLNSDDNKQSTPEYSQNNEDVRSVQSDDNKQCTPKAKISLDEKESEIYALPTALGGIPIESTEVFDSEDEIFAAELRQKYAKQLEMYTALERMNFIHRYTIGYKHLKKKKRMGVVCTDIDYGFEMYDKYKLDRIIETESSADELDAWKQFLYGEDKCGHPIIFDMIGSSDCKKMKRVFMDPSLPFGQQAYLHVFRFMRKAENYKRQNTLKYGRQIHKHIQVMDMKGFKSDHLKGQNRKITKTMITALSRMFPEATYKMYIINAPRFFRALWSTVKGFLDPVTAGKTKVLGEDYLKEMVKDIPIEMIPPSYGGKGVWQIQLGSVPKNYNVDVYHGLD